MSTNGFVYRLVAALVLLALVVAGGFLVYRAGIAQGTAQAPEVAKAISQAAQNGQPVPVAPMYGYGYGYPYGRGFHPFGVFPFFGCLIPFLIIFFFFGLMRFVFRPWGWGHHGYWGRRWEGGRPPIFDEWHKRAHEAPAEGGQADRNE